MSSSALAWSIQDPSRAASSKFQYVMGAGPPSQCAQRLHEHLVLLRISAFAEGDAGHLRGEGPHRGIQSKVPSVLQRPGDLSLMEQNYHQVMGLQTFSFGSLGGQFSQVPWVPHQRSPRDQKPTSASAQHLQDCPGRLLTQSQPGKAVLPPQRRPEIPTLLVWAWCPSIRVT